MKATVFIATDGSITTYDTKGIRMPALSGDMTVIHRIIDNYKVAFCKVDPSVRIVNPEIYVKNDMTNERIKIDMDTLVNWGKFVIRPKPIRKTPQLDC